MLIYRKDEEVMEKKNGRPRRVLTEEERKDIVKMAPYVTQEQLADFLKINCNTLKRIFDEDELLFKEYKKAKVVKIGKAAGKLWELIEQNDRASIFFYLKTQAGWKETDRREMVGEDGGPILTKNVSDLTDEELKQKLKEYNVKTLNLT